MGKSRSLGLDLLRCLSCISVVILHVSSIYLKKDLPNNILSNTDYAIGLFYRIVTTLAVPSFVMLSGAFLLNSKNRDYKAFYQKMTKRIIYPTVLFSIVYVVMHYCEMILAKTMGVSIGNEKYNMWTPLLNCLKGEPNATMWFMFMIIGLYLVTPVIVRVKETIGQRNYMYFAIGLFIYGILIFYTCDLSWILWYTEWMGYFVLGNLIYEHFCKKNKGKKDILLGWFCIVISYGILVVYWFCNFYIQKEAPIPESFSMPVLAGTVLQFIGFSLLNDKIRINKSVSEIAKYSLGIYLIHPILCEFIMQICGRILKWLPSAHFIPIISIIITLACLEITKVMVRLKIL